MRVVFAVTGASGTIYAVRLLELLKTANNIEIELIVSESARKILKHELNMSVKELEKLAKACYEPDDLFAPPASGSHLFDAMIVVPCSMKTLACIANGIAANLITRAADVCLKEHRKLILVPRESPLNAIHLENMTKLAKLGVTIAPPMPGFYSKPKKIDDIVDHVAGRLADQLGVKTKVVKRWGN